MCLLKFWLSLIAFGNQTISWSVYENFRTFSQPLKTHGFASLPRSRFALIVCNRRLKEQCRGIAMKAPTAIALNNI
jgi:hypothetical protein